MSPTRHPRVTPAAGATRPPAAPPVLVTVLLAVVVAAGDAGPAAATAPLDAPAVSRFTVDGPALGFTGPDVPVSLSRETPGTTAGVWPFESQPEVVHAFRPPASAFGPGHRGVDLAGRSGQRVRAALSGRVSFAGLVAGRGVVVVDHGALRTTYEPVTASVAVGDPVATGQVIGMLEWFGSHCTPSACLHWGLLEGDEYRDPLTLVGHGPIRLLPLTGAAFPADGAVPGGGTVRLPSQAVGQARGWAWR